MAGKPHPHSRQTKAFSKMPTSNPYQSKFPLISRNIGFYGSMTDKKSHEWRTADTPTGNKFPQGDTTFRHGSDTTN